MDSFQSWRRGCNGEARPDRGVHGDENFRAMHEHNPLGRGVTSADIVAAIDYLIASPVVTGELLTIDAGQRFDPPSRDVQFLET